MARFRKKAAWESADDVFKPIIYCRVSTRQQIDNTSLDDQEAKLRAEVEKRGWGDALVLREEGRSAKDMNRPQLKEAFKHLANGSRNVLLVTKLDRLTRSSKDLLTLTERIEAEGWEIVILDGTVAFDSTTAAGRMMLGMMGLLAQFEREQIRERVTGAYEYMRTNAKDGVIAAELEERIIAMYNSGEHTMWSICDVLNSEGIPTARGGKWMQSTIQRVLNRDRDKRKVAKKAARRAA